MPTLRILLIEDNPADILLVKEALRAHHVAADLEVIKDGESAYSYWDRFLSAKDAPCPDLVLLDLNLPKRGGLEILKRIRETPHCSDLHVMIMSSSASMRDVEQASALGIHDYFRKPTHLDEYLDLGRIIKIFGDKQVVLRG